MALDRDVDALERLRRESAAECKVLALPCYVTDEQACTAAIATAVQQLGRIDAVINNAGISHRSPLKATATTVLRRVMDVNLFGAIHLTRPALPALRQSRGLIVAVSSVAGTRP